MIIWLTMILIGVCWMYEYNQKMLYRVYACFCLILLCFTLYVGCAGGAGTNGQQSSTNREIGRIEEQERQVGAEISRAGAEIESAEDAIGRASVAVGNSQERARAVQAGVEECQKLTRECQGLAKRNAELVDGLGKEN